MANWPYRVLAELTKKLTFFEGNRGTVQREIEEELRHEGFGDIHLLGLCDGDCPAVNNWRPQYIARKRGAKLNPISQLGGDRFE